jgi:hypothetical protein
MSDYPAPRWSASFWAADFRFSAEIVRELTAYAKRHEIEDIALFIEKMQSICQAHLGDRERQDTRLAEGKVNAILRELIKHATAIGKLLEQPEVTDKLHLLAMEGNYVWFKSGGRQFLRELPKNLKTLVEIGNTLPKSGRGRPDGGGKNTAGWRLAILLCSCLAGYGVRVRKIVSEGRQAGLAHRLLDIVREPLGLGAGELDGILNNVIDAMEKDNRLN